MATHGVAKRKSNKNKQKAILAAGVAAGIATIFGYTVNAGADDSVPAPVDTDLQNFDLTATAGTTVYARNAAFNLTTSSDKNLVAPGSTVTYTYLLKNTGTVDFKNIRITDDKCEPVKFVNGNDSDPLFNVGETWKYTCATKVLKDQTNLARVTATPVIPETSTSPSPTPTGTVTPTPTPSPTATGGTIKDGTFLGKQATVVVAGEGISYPIQVQATVSGGKLTAVTVPVFGATDTTSKNIGKYNVATLAAMNSDPANPTMIFEALQAQSANIAVISGATYTTAGFKTSLADALVQAGF